MSESCRQICLPRSSSLDRRRSSLDKNELCCQICHQTTCVNMVKLPCNHSICKQCLSKWSLVTNNNDNNKDIECPFCRSIILTHSELNFERSYYRNMLEDITNTNVRRDMLCFKQESKYMENCILERTNTFVA